MKLKLKAVDQDGNVLHEGETIEGDRNWGTCIMWDDDLEDKLCEFTHMDPVRCITITAERVDSNVETKDNPDTKTFNEAMGEFTAPN